MAKEKFKLLEGSIWAIPTKVGFFQCLVTRVPERQTQFPTCYAYIHPEPRADAGDCAKLDPIKSWGSCWHGFITLRPFRTGRWANVGQYKAFTQSDWPAPVSDSETVLGKESRDLPLAGHVYAGDGSMRLRGCVPIPAGKDHLISASQSACTASSFEKALADTHTNRKAGFWDALAVFFDVDRSVIDRWTAGVSEFSADLDPPGAAYDRPVAEGDLIAFPAVGGGFGVGLVARVTKGRGVQEVAWFTLDKWYPNRPTLQDLGDINQSMSLRFYRVNTWECRYGTWSPLGAMPDYNRDRWVIPPQLVYTGIEMPSGDPWMPNRLGKIVPGDLESDDLALRAYPGPYDPLLVCECDRWNSYSTSRRVEREHGLWHHCSKQPQGDEQEGYAEQLSPEIVEKWRQMVDF